MGWHACAAQQHRPLPTPLPTPRLISSKRPTPGRPSRRAALPALPLPPRSAEEATLFPWVSTRANVPSGFHLDHDELGRSAEECLRALEQLQVKGNTDYEAQLLEAFQVGLAGWLVAVGVVGGFRAPVGPSAGPCCSQGRGWGFVSITLLPASGSGWTRPTLAPGTGQPRSPLAPRPQSAFCGTFKPELEFHMRQEELEGLPLIRAHFTAEELRPVEARMLAALSSQQVGRGACTCIALLLPLPRVPTSTQTAHALSANPPPPTHAEGGLPARAGRRDARRLLQAGRRAPGQPPADAARHAQVRQVRAPPAGPRQAHGACRHTLLLLRCCKHELGAPSPALQPPPPARRKYARLLREIIDDSGSDKKGLLRL